MHAKVTYSKEVIHMYLLKHSSSVYYHRFPVPVSLRDRGFPCEIRLSLLTKDRQTALERNIQMSLIVRRNINFALIDDTLTHSDARSALNGEVSILRKEYSLRTPQTAHSYRVPIKSSIKQIFDARQALSDFLTKKKSDNVTALTIHQLEQRISHCFDFVEAEKKQYDAAMIDAYVAYLKADKCSAKTNKEYFSSVKQFFSWCHNKCLIKVNPCIHSSPKFKSTKHASEQRDTWKAHELDLLFHSASYQSKYDDFRYITELQVYHGLRPNEACQLSIVNVQYENDMWFLDITDAGDQQHLKNSHSVRQIPLHPAMLENGFAKFVQTKAATSSPETPLFRYKPYGNDHDWSKHYRTEFGRLQTQLGMLAGSRPTAYGFRHTFIDTLKNEELTESLVSEFVGHANQSMTFGRYGKKLKLKKLLKVVHTFKLPTSKEV